MTHHHAEVLWIALLAPGTLAAQAGPTSTGPVIESAGPVFAVPHPDFETPPDMTYRVAFEIVEAPPTVDRPNPQLVTVARFLNMHGRAGVPLERLDVAVVHGPAGRALLDDEAYRGLEGVANPHVRLIRELADAGVRIILCGQTAAARRLRRDRLLPSVEMALSAMTAFVVLQEQGYHLNPF